MSLEVKVWVKDQSWTVFNVSDRFDCALDNKADGEADKVEAAGQIFPCQKHFVG